MQTDKRSYMINATSKKEGDFKIPVVHVLDGEPERNLVNSIQYHSNRSKGSKHLKPTYAGGGGCYQNSHKKQ